MIKKYINIDGKIVRLSEPENSKDMETSHYYLMHHPYYFYKLIYAYNNIYLIERQYLANKIIVSNDIRMKIHP